MRQLFGLGTDCRDTRSRGELIDNPRMSQAEFFPSETTILYNPAWYSSTAREEHTLPLPPGDYKVTPGERWTVTSLKDSATVYCGVGPVEIHRAEMV
jgi:hypothetical protein